MSEQDTHEIRQDSGAESREAANQLRRKIIKTGVVAVPVIISLQSGTAWALSSCASKLKRPSTSQLDSTFGDFSKDPTSTQRRNRETVTSLTGIPEKKKGKDRHDIESIVNDFSGSGAGRSYPNGPGDSVETGDMIHLMVTNGSCWTSYCSGPIKRTRDVSIYNNTSPSVCK
ncbi:hypothetical protein [Iodidimonas sp. SYSU 1G8]|uniref:hypothetical protein n=1 Tax=Iodidimonas sp. SYSU 1G8 TaxID=3133967 RepID=UPI0031FE6282